LPGDDLTHSPFRPLAVTELSEIPLGAANVDDGELALTHEFQSLASESPQSLGGRFALCLC
jgi:hypothetical protein